jgi:acetyl esterase/lipase
MVKNLLAAVLLAGITHSACAQEKMNLYPDQHDLRIGGRDKIADAPFIEHYSAGRKNGAAVLVVPGGGYTFLAEGHEGKEIAAFFNSKGYDAIVLHYRVNDTAQQGARYPAQYNDAVTAMRLVKSKAATWGLNPEKIGVIGFSAGGHLASCLATMIQAGSKPAFAVLVYPVISLDTPYRHAGSATMLLGNKPGPGMIDSLSTQHRVSAQTPPVMLIHATDDKVVPVENSLLFYDALRAHQVPATLHVYDHGGHGFGLAVKDPVLNTWPALCISWLEGLGIK